MFTFRAQPSVPNPLTHLNATGVQAYGVYDGTKECIDLSNGNVNLQIPLLSLPQRGGRTFELKAIADTVLTHRETNFPEIRQVPSIR